MNGGADFRVWVCVPESGPQTGCKLKLSETERKIIYEIFGADFITATGRPVCRSAGAAAIRGQRGVKPALAEEGVLP